MVWTWIATGALAQGWTAFDGAFPLAPCPDGWAACLVGERRLDTEPLRDAEGRPIPADARIGWFDLEATPSFSPLVGLSAYAAPVVPAPAAPQRRGVARPPDRDASPPIVVPRVQAPPPLPPPLPRAPGCADLVGLEAQAALGQLAPDAVACLDGRVAGDPALTDRRRASLLLLANAWGAGRRDEWRALAQRHLTELDASDPDLCYKFALDAWRRGEVDAALKWTEVALENRAAWTGDTYRARVFSLYKVRAAAAEARWQAAEQAHLARPTDETAAAVERARSVTKVDARDWLEYARLAGKDTATALALCLSAAGTADYCD